MATDSASTPSRSVIAHSLLPCESSWDRRVRFAHLTRFRNGFGKFRAIAPFVPQMGQIRATTLSTPYFDSRIAGRVRHEGYRGNSIVVCASESRLFVAIRMQFNSELCADYHYEFYWGIDLLVRLRDS